ncbi:hypothetical protein, unknown function [Leishmania tarentolae]|uniref:RING-type domain-containing protein n=1 Tax=Leishmania tarentolae TaxID=5689 RepID=A0A640KA60_LEITA|nr:hypothetical protein, unknown function [Leishmania tarentolae]
MPQSPQRKKNRDDSNGDIDKKVAAIAFGVGVAVGVLANKGFDAFYSWWTEEKVQREKGYYFLPPRDKPPQSRTGLSETVRSSSGTACAADNEVRKTAGNDAPSHNPHVLSDESGVSKPDSADGHNLCVLCLMSHSSFMFVECRHVCLCEPCVIELGRDYEDRVLGHHFRGPMRVPCPMCRTVGYLTKTYAS